MRIPFAQIDAFASAPFTGNAAAVMPLGTWLDDAVLQNIAAENNLSETAFLVASTDGEADFDLRWFTPTAEVVLCGHATLASGHFVLSSAPDRDSVRFRTRKAGMLEVARAGAGYELELPAWVPEPRPLPAIVAALGVGSAVETLWHPHRYGLVVVETADQVRALDPDFRALAREGEQSLPQRGRVVLVQMGANAAPVVGAAVEQQGFDAVGAGAGDQADVERAGHSRANAAENLARGRSAGAALRGCRSPRCPPYPCPDPPWRSAARRRA